MQYVIQILAAILIGISIGALFGPRHTARFIGSLAAIVLALVTIATANWMILAVGTAIYLFVMLLPAGATSRA